MDLKGKNVLVTGGAVRIGRAICEKVGRRGANVVIHYNRSEREARSLASDLAALGVEAYLVQGDLSKAACWEGVVGEASDKAGGLDALINNAAIFSKDSFDGISEAQFEAQIRVNFTAPMMLMRRFVRRSGRKQASVVNLLDRRVVGVDPDCLSYQISKKMLAEVTRGVAYELWPRIRVNAVAPGAILPPPGEDDKRVKDMAGKIPLGRTGDPCDVAEAVVFLLESKAITGEVLFVDGGHNLGA